MGSNALPKNTGDLTKLCTNMASGLAALGQALEITQVTAAGLQARLTAFTLTNAGFNTARKTEQDASSACTEANGAIRAWLTTTRAVLVTRLGAAWSASWTAAGFTANSTAVPRTVGERFKLTGLLETFLTENPDYEDAKVKVTAAEAARLKKQSVDADAALSPAETDAGKKKIAREAALTALTDAMSMLVGILDRLLAADDPRWATFGLNEPAAETTPAAPTNLTVTVVEGPALLCECDAVPTATRYRWRTRLAGARNYTLATSTPGPLVQIAGVAEEETIEVIVQAVSGSAQSVASEMVRVTIPAAEENAAPVRAAASNGTGENGTSGAAMTAVAHASGNGAPSPRLIA